MAERLFVVFTLEEGAALTMLTRRSPAERTLALGLLAKIRSAVREQPPPADAVDPQAPDPGTLPPRVTHRVVH